MCRGVRCTDKRRAASSLIFTRPRSARRSRVSRLSSFMGLLLLRLFKRNLLVRIFHALALVGLRRPEAADLRRRLPDPLPIDALDDDLGLAGRLDRDAVGDRIIDQMRVAQSQGEALRLHRGAKADTPELELLLVPLGDARDHVREMSAGRTGDRVRSLDGGVGPDLEVLV